MKNIVDEISIVAQMDPDRPAIVSDGIEVSYRQLDTGIRHVEGWLTQEGLRTWNVGASDFVKLGSPSNTDLVMVNCEDPIDFVMCELAALDVGAQVIPVPPRVASATRIEMIRKTHPGRILRKLVKGSKPMLNRPQFQTGKLVDITSGSTGAKKLVDRPMENLNDEATAVAERLGLHMGVKVLVTTPLAHSFGGGMMRAVFISGATLYVPMLNRSLPPQIIQVKQMIPNVDIVTSVPYLYKVMLRSWNYPKRLSSLRAYAGGEYVAAELMYQWWTETGSFLMQEYGLSEGGICTIGDQHLDSIGIPIKGVRFEIEDDEELIMYRPWAPKKYHFGESAKTFRADGGIHTGDLGYRDDKGYYYIDGRKKSVVIVAGMKVVPLEVERVLQSHPDVDEAVVFGEPDPVRGERLVAIVTTTVSRLDTKSVMRFVKERLESYKVPRQLFVTTEFPRTVSGKIDRGLVVPQRQEVRS